MSGKMRAERPRRSGLRRVSGSERGVALLIVLWVLVILMAIVFSFSFMARTETHGTIHFKEGAERRLLAQAGMERAITELFRRALYNGRPGVVEAGDVVRVDGTLYRGALGDGAYTYKIIEESGKININLLNDASAVILSNLLTNRGVSKEDADAIVDSLLDWKDPDELTRLHGAESDYYMSLREPYRSKNAPFDTVEELLMVKGITPAVLYGGEGRPGIFAFLTVHSGSAAINVNTAAREVLAALPGMSWDMADRLILARTPGDIKGLQEAASIAGVAPELISPYVSFSESNTYTMEAAGYKKSSRQGFLAAATVTIQGETYRYVSYKSPAGGSKRP